jgi:hypothetical protein
VFCPGFGVGFKGMPSAFMSMPAHAKVKTSSNKTLLGLPATSSSVTTTQAAVAAAAGVGAKKGKVYYSPDFVFGKDSSSLGNTSMMKLASRLLTHQPHGKPKLYGENVVIGLLDISKVFYTIYLSNITYNAQETKIYQKLFINKLFSCFPFFYQKFFFLYVSSINIENANLHHQTHIDWFFSFFGTSRQTLQNALSNG